MTFQLTIIGFIIGAIWVFITVLKGCAEDSKNDPTYKHYQKWLKANCTHQGEKTDIVVETATTCEDIWTMCDDCNEVISKRTEC